MHQGSRKIDREEAHDDDDEMVDGGCGALLILHGCSIASPLDEARNECCYSSVNEGRYCRFDSIHQAVDKPS